jgi:serine protease AprX
MFQPHTPQLKSFLVSPPVRQQMDAQDPAHPAPIAVIITLRESKNEPQRGVSGSKQHVREFLEQRSYTVQESDFFVFARLLPADIDALANQKDWVYQIWKDETCYAHLLASVDTVKASASWRTFDSRGKGIVWAVLDTGVKGDHPHFDGNIDPALSKNFSNSKTLDDCNGHGTHVAGIIAGCARPKADQQAYKASTLAEDEDDPEIVALEGCPSGVAPLARIISVKVLDDDGTGSASAAIMGLEYVRKLNQNSRYIAVDGVNMSLGYPFDPKWYGCGHSPLCEEVTRAVRSGLVVVISCGNSGYGVTKLDNGQEVPTWIDLSISDPANTEEAIAVGSVHKTAPHMYGVSYFSSKGPTGDGRTKPDLVAPGEKVISCSIHLDKGFEYEERSGTSVAAPHVSGAAAAFLSAHPEFRGNPRQVKDIFMKTATDLNRDRAFQGAGLIDTMRAISAV